MKAKLSGIIVIGIMLLLVGCEKKLSPIAVLKKAKSVRLIPKEVPSQNMLVLNNLSDMDNQGPGQMNLLKIPGPTAGIIVEEDTLFLTSDIIVEEDTLFVPVNTIISIGILPGDCYCQGFDQKRKVKSTDEGPAEAMDVSRGSARECYPVSSHYVVSKNGGKELCIYNSTTHVAVKCVSTDDKRVCICNENGQYCIYE